MSKDAYYFSHDANARFDDKVLMLRMDHGWEGYGIYWALIEMMFENTSTSISHEKVKGIAYTHNIDITVLESVINTCIAEGLFLSDDKIFWSETLRKRKSIFTETKRKKSEAGKKGMKKRWGDKDEKKNDNGVITENSEPITLNNKVKESKVNESKGNEDEVIEEPKTKDPSSSSKNPVRYIEENLGFRLSNNQMQETWAFNDDFKGESDIIIHAANIACDRDRKNFGFVKGRLIEWLQHNLKTLDDVMQYEKHKFGPKEEKKAKSKIPNYEELLEGENA